MAKKSGTPAVNMIDRETTIFWFRRDLRMDDNAGLYHALKTHGNVQPVFIFDTVILDRLEDKDDARVTFIHAALEHLQKLFVAQGSSLLVLHGDPVALFATLTPKAIFTNHDYEPYARERDAAIAKACAARDVEFKTFKDQVIFEKDEVMKDDGKPYTVFTPYSRKWKATLNAFYGKLYPVKKYLARLKQGPPIPVLTLEEIGFKTSTLAFPPREIRRSIIEKYDLQRNFPAVAGTTHLSVHLRFGTVSIRALVAIAKKKNEVWLNELIWRDFYHMILWHFPAVATRAFKPAYDHIAWRNNEAEFKAWCEGRTGYPLVDAGMRELNATGFMHNRVRMVVASFLTKHLLIDWRWGEAYFARKLLDFDLAANNGGWQWAAGSGCDAAPYFRVFNPALQMEKFDSKMAYVKKWVPELDTPDYPSPIVEHTVARERVLRVYKEALNA